MAKEHIYKARVEAEGLFSVFKLEQDFSPVETYSVSRREANGKELWFCSCYAGSRPDCRHRQIVRLFLIEGFDRAFDYDKHKWIELQAGEE